MVGISYKNYVHYNLHRSCLLISEIAIIFYFLVILKEALTFLSQ